MIRRSTMIALAAVLMSLLFHAFGLSFSGGFRPKGKSEDGKKDVITVSNAFEDVAETVAEPVLPEPAPTPETKPEEETAPEPEPEEETVPEPETAESPTTEVLVASSNPQKTPVPDTGETLAVRPDAAGPSELENGTVPEPTTVQTAGGEDSEVADAVTSPVEPDTVSEVPEGTPDASAEPAEAITVEPAPAPSGEQLAALPAPAAPAVPAVPIAPTPDPSAVPVIPLVPETIEPETPETAVAPESTESVETEESADGSDQAVLSSLRPQLPNRRPTPQPEGQPDGSAEAEARTSRPRLIESPLTAYRRDGTDLTIPRSGGTQSGGSGSQNFRGPGNSDVTNYAGRVFVHLNQAPSVRVSARGWTRVFFEINPDGSVGRIDIIDGTGSAEIERAAKAQIRAAEPLPRPPNGNVRRMNLFYRPN